MARVKIFGSSYFCYGGKHFNRHESYGYKHVGRHDASCEGGTFIEVTGESKLPDDFKIKLGLMVKMPEDKVCVWTNEKGEVQAHKVYALPTDQAENAKVIGLNEYVDFVDQWNRKVRVVILPDGRYEKRYRFLIDDVEKAAVRFQIPTEEAWQICYDARSERDVTSVIIWALSCEQLLKAQPSMQGQYDILISQDLEHTELIYAYPRYPRPVGNGDYQALVHASIAYLKKLVEETRKD